MGSASDAKPRQGQLNELTNKKSIKHIIKSIFNKDFRKNKCKLEPEIENEEIPPPSKPVVATPVMSLLDNFEKLNLNKQTDRAKERDGVSAEEEIMRNFTVKTINVKGSIYASNSSEDSGFAEKEISTKSGDESTNDVEESFDRLRIDPSESKDEKDDGKKKRLQTVFVPRGPIRGSLVTLNVRHPYQQISQINKQTFSGGQVTVNTESAPQTSLTQVDESLEINRALSHVDAIVNIFTQRTMEEQDMLLQIATDFITEDNLLSDFGEEILKAPNEDVMPNFLTNYENRPNPVEEFNANMFNAQGFDDFAMENQSFKYIAAENEFDSMISNSILTPPRSNEGPHYSPNARSPNFYNSPPYANSTSVIHNSPETDYSLSPDRLSPNNFQSDYENEKSHDIDESQFPSCIIDNSEIIERDLKYQNAKSKEKVRRSSSISMKSIKDMQKELQGQFSKTSCCKRDRVCYKKVFHDHFHKLSLEQRKNICLRIANMDFRTAYGVLHHILVSLSSELCEQDSIQYAIFYLICQQILSQKPALFLKEFGLNLLEAAALRCYGRAELTRYLVRCIRCALATDVGKNITKGPLFTEVDTLGENLVGACARAGDRYAGALAEIVIRAPSEVPLFDVSHTNTEGYTPLHVACLQHNPSEGRSCLHTVHVLVAHAKADLDKGDNKGGDTALHLSVNSVHCDLRLVQTLFLHIDRKLWRQYAHCHNRSSVSPLEYARSATKSTARRDYPQEVLDMLRKCR